MSDEPTNQTRLPEPWRSFLAEVDAALRTPLQVHCLGGFVLGVLWELPRPTADVDVVAIRPSGSAEELLRVAGDGSEISRRRGLHFQQVTIAECPEGYESRWTSEIFFQCEASTTFAQSYRNQINHQISL